MTAHHRFPAAVLCLFIALSASRSVKAQNCDSIDRYDQRRHVGLLEKAGPSFAFRLFQTINQEKKEENLCISPFSASMALSMTLNGAEGETLEEMRTTLGFAELTSGQINCAYPKIVEAMRENAGNSLQFENANSIWIRTGFGVYDEFIATNRTTYDAEVATLNFNDTEASKTINDWVKKNTKGKIKDIVPEQISPLVMMYLINAIYFKGTWQWQFDKSATAKEEFTLPGGEKINHDLMKVEGTFAYGKAEDGTQLIELPYKTEKGEFSMVVVLPPQGKEIDDYIQGLDERRFITMFDVLDRGNSEGTLYLPKFTMKSEQTLKQTLTAMGMSRAFDSMAEFERISTTNLFISEVRQKTFVEVNEEGTEAAAVTSVEMAHDSSIPPPHFNMRVDRPFLFIIASADPDAILFFAKVIDPR